MRIDHDVIVQKREDVCARLANAGVKGIRFAWPRFEEVTEAAGIASTEIIDGLSRLVLRVVINDQNLPVNRFRKHQSGRTVQRGLQALASIVGAQYDRNFHMYSGRVSHAPLRRALAVYSLVARHSLRRLRPPMPGPPQRVHWVQNLGENLSNERDRKQERIEAIAERQESFFVILPVPA